ncbi:hypothetical protein IWX75_003188 [Arthrobacter sp. CAN_A6]|uniref:hypothetical protein n=1 Tax=Arthrobacter sp. CAN_A6 TaxID=2787721 RepID=UPI0018CB6A30
MCGACGKTAVPDPVLGPVRTLRQRLLVAQTVNTLCSGIAGLPTVQVAGDGWMVRSATGASTSCSTVHRIWEALVGSCVRFYGNPQPIIERLVRPTSASANRGHDDSAAELTEAVAVAGLSVAGGAGSRTLPE